MDATLFAQMLSDKKIINLKKLSYKYPQADMKEFVSLLETGFYKSIPLKDFNGHSLVFLEASTQIQLSAVRVLLTPQNSSRLYSQKAMEEEIISTFTIENIDFSRDSVRKIMAGYAPADESEARIYGMKKGLEFISDKSHEITEENIHCLYETAIGDYLPEGDRLLPGNFYRHDAVYIMGSKVERTGIPWTMLKETMQKLVCFIHDPTPENALLKAAMIHFYIAYVHPYFDGNGRMARLIHLWYLAQRGYSSALFIPLSEFINKTRKKYYDAFTLTEENAQISGHLDVTPFLIYFIENVYNKLSSTLTAAAVTTAFDALLADGSVTKKETELWRFVLSAYGTEEFSTKQLEKDFGQAAYATIRAFVIKFEKFGLLNCTKYGSRNKYSVQTG